ncbi:MAG TPA: hypothetical protein VNZ58_08195 [Thermomicrobiales bacterium]|nr:hypothetical protein [Thermomicrobiales bacterium]
MAYRFILEVPESLVGDANVVINTTGDAQAHHVRDSHGLGIDDPYKDFSIAAHSLRIIDGIYAWYADMGANNPAMRINIRIVLHSGDRLSVGDIPKSQMIAAIRRDQPWVDRTIPKIGEHETRTTGGTEVIESDVVVDDAMQDEAAVAVALERPIVGEWVKPTTILAADEEMARAGITVAGVPQVLIQAYGLAKAQRVYGELFGLEVIGRGNRHADGSWEFLPARYDMEQEAQWGNEPDFAFLKNGPLSVAVERMGRGLPLDVYRELLKPINVVVDMPSLRRIRALVLMRSYNVIDATRDDVFIFRDPFAYTWAVIGQNGEQ